MNQRAEFIRSVKYLLEWMPICSVGSSGHQRRVAVEKALQAFEEEDAAVSVPDATGYSGVCC